MPKDIARIMQMMLAPAGEMVHQIGWKPSADVYRTNGGWLVKFDLAGVRPTDIQVTVSGRRLIVRGCRRDWVVEEGRGCSAYSMEISYSTFERCVELPCELDEARTITEYRDGMLLVQLTIERGQP